MPINESKVDNIYHVEQLSRCVEIPDSAETTSHKANTDENEERGNWSGRLDFFLSCLGYAVGLGNVWRFPYLAYRNGGAVFFIPYLIMLVFVGLPIFVLELSLGQYTSSGPLTCWSMAPGFKGIGVGMMITSALVSVYYNMIIAWAIFYTYASFTSDLPWQYCDRDWNTDWCWSRLFPSVIVNAENCTSRSLRAEKGVCFNDSRPVTIYNTTEALTYGYASNLPTEEYFVNYVLGRSDTIEDTGTPKWELVLCLLIAWALVCVSLIKGIKSSGKVVYFTALFPYVVLIILLGNGISLDGMENGIRFYIMEVEWSKLTEAAVWKDAASQIFFSLSTSWGGLITLSSYNRYHTDCVRDSVIVSFANCLTSLFAGFVIFAYIGFLATDANKDVSEVVQSGTGLAFVVYTDAVTRMPVSSLWSVLFFLMLITLGLDSEFASVETVVTSTLDQFPSLRKYKSYVIVIFSGAMFLLGLLLTTNSGYWWLSLVNEFAGNWNVMVIAILECLCIAYVYRAAGGSFAWTFVNDIECMIGSRTLTCIPWCWFSYWWRICWSLFTPIGLLFLLVFTFMNTEKFSDSGYEYPVWANVLGWLISTVPVFGILVMFVWQVVSELMNAESQGLLRSLFEPNKYWGPALLQYRRQVRHLPRHVVDPYHETHAHTCEPDGASHDAPACHWGFDDFVEQADGTLVAAL